MIDFPKGEDKGCVLIAIETIARLQKKKLSREKVKKVANFTEEGCSMFGTIRAISHYFPKVEAPLLKKYQIIDTLDKSYLIFLNYNIKKREGHVFPLFKYDDRYYTYNRDGRQHLRLLDDEELAASFYSEVLTQCRIPHEQSYLEKIGSYFFRPNRTTTNNK